MTVAEAGAVKNAGGVLVAVTAPIERRFKWAQKRGRITDSVTLEEFKDREHIESQGKSHEQNMTAVVEMADIILSNEGTLDELRKKVDDMARNIGVTQ